jgi:hypothetical protein
MEAGFLTTMKDGFDSDEIRVFVYFEQSDGQPLQGSDSGHCSAGERRGANAADLA